MHELSIALSIVEIVKDEASKHHVASVDEIELDVGELSGIDIQSLITSIQVASSSTIAEKAKVVVNQINAIGKCNSCHYEFSTRTVINRCGNCGSTSVLLLSGKEFKVKSILIN